MARRVQHDEPPSAADGVAGASGGAALILFAQNLPDNVSVWITPIIPALAIVSVPILAYVKRWILTRYVESQVKGELRKVDRLVKDVDDEIKSLDADDPNHSPTIKKLYALQKKLREKKVTLIQQRADRITIRSEQEYLQEMASLAESK